MFIDDGNSEVQQQIDEPTSTTCQHGIRGGKRERPIFLRYIKVNLALLLLFDKLTFNNKGAVFSLQTQFRKVLFFGAKVCVSKQLLVCWDVIHWVSLILIDCLHRYYSLTQFIDTSYQRNSRT